MIPFPVIFRDFDLRFDPDLFSEFLVTDPVGKTERKGPAGIPVHLLLQSIETEGLECGKAEDGVFLQGETAFPAGQPCPDLHGIGKSRLELRPGVEENDPFGGKRKLRFLKDFFVRPQQIEGRLFRPPRGVGPGENDPGPDLRRLDRLVEDEDGFGL